MIRFLLFVSLLFSGFGLNAQELLVFKTGVLPNTGRTIAREFVDSYKVPSRIVDVESIKNIDRGVLFCFNEILTWNILNELFEFSKRGGMLVINGGCFSEIRRSMVSVISEAGTSKTLFLNKPLIGKTSVLNPAHEIVDVFDTPLKQFGWKPLLYSHESKNEKKSEFEPDFGRKYMYYCESVHGKGKILYIASFFPFLGYGASDTVEEFLVLKERITEYFSETGAQLFRILPWPPPYKAAVYARHDFDRSMAEPDLDWVYELIDDYQTEENAYGLTGNYFITMLRFTEDDGRLLKQFKKLHSKQLVRVLSHSFSHRRFDLDPQREKQDISRSFEFLKKNFNTHGISFVFPYYSGITPVAHEFIEEQGISILGEQTLGLPYPFFTINVLKPEYRKFKHIQLPLNVYHHNHYVELSFSNILETLSHFKDNFSQMRLMIDRVYSIGGLINLYTHFRKGNGQIYRRYFKLLKTYRNVWKPSSQELFQWWCFRDKLKISYSNGFLFLTNGSNTGSIEFTLACEDLNRVSHKNFKLKSAEKVKVPAGHFNMSPNRKPK